MKTERSTLWLGVALLALASSAANAAFIRSPGSAVASNQLTGFEIEHTIDHSGLLTDFTSGVDDFDTYLAGNPLHSLGANTEWFTDTGVNSAVVTYDMGQLFTIDKLAIWNEDGAGIVTFDVLVSSDGLNFVQIASNLAPTNHPVINYPADVFLLPVSQAKLVRLNIDSCPQPGDLYNGCSMGEIAFSTAAVVPEPTTLALFGLALVGLGFARRRVI